MAHLSERRARLDQQRLVAPLKPVTAFAPQSVETVGQGRLLPLHASDKVTSRRLHREVVVVAHDHKHMQHLTRLRARLEKAGLERDLGPRGSEDVAPIFGAIDDVINHAGEFAPELACYADLQGK